MSLIKLKPYNLIGLGNDILAQEVRDIPDNALIYIPREHVLVENKEEIKPELFLKHSDKDAYVFNAEEDSRIFIVNIDKSHGKLSFTTELESATVSGFVFYTYYVFDPITFVKSVKPQLDGKAIPIEFASSKIEGAINGIIHKSYAKGDTQEDLLKKIKAELNYQLDDTGIKIESLDINGFYTIEDREPEPLSKVLAGDNDDEIILDMTGTGESSDEIIIDDDEDLFADPIPAKPYCKNCGYVPDGKVPKFCPECGHKFDV